MLTTDDLLTPKGRLHAPSLWPDDRYDLGYDENAVDEALTAYLVEGRARAAAITDAADLDTASRLWGYYRAWDEAYNRLLLMPSTVNSSDEGGSSYLLTQIEHVGELAAEALAEFTTMVEVGSAVAFIPRLGSQAVETRYSW